MIFFTDLALVVSWHYKHISLLESEQEKLDVIEQNLLHESIALDKINQIDDIEKSLQLIFTFALIVLLDLAWSVVP